MRLSWTADEIRHKANELRIGALDAIYEAGSGHPGGSLSAADIIGCLYYNVMDVDPSRPARPDRDRLVLSKGHSCPILYAALADRGFFPRRWLMGLRKLGEPLQGHPDSITTPGVDFSTGSLGQGLSAGLGMAMACKYMGNENRIYVVLGDGDMQEGQTWEAASVAAHHGLDNLCAIFDSNGLQGEGAVHDIHDLRDIGEKFRQFGWEAARLDGHDIDALLNAFSRAADTQGKPFLIVAETVKGKGVSFMEHEANWHGSRSPTLEQLELAKYELDRATYEMGEQ